MSVAPLHAVSSAAPAQFNAAALRQASPREQRAAVAAQFEAVLVRQLLGSTMHSMLGGAQGGVAGSVYGDMLADTMAQQLTAGRGLGLSHFIQQQLTPRGEQVVPPADAPRPESAPAHRPPATAS